MSFHFLTIEDYIHNIPFVLCLYFVYTYDSFSARVQEHAVLYLTETFMVKTLYHCNLLCYVKCSTSLLTFEVVQNYNPYDIIIKNMHTHSVSQFLLQCWHVEGHHYNLVYPTVTCRRHEEHLGGVSLLHW